MTSYKIDGFVAKGFEPVRTQFEQNFIDGLEKCAQMCVFIGEEMVIDLWGSVNGSKEYDGDTITNVFSSSKSLTAICMATLVDKNLMDYGDKVTKYWPEYENGDKEKESITIADVLRHEGGMANFSKTLRLVDIMRENIKKNSIGNIIEKEPLQFPSTNSKSKAEYHSATRGWILNEIFRRIDPQRRTIGECLRDEISIPLNADCYIGLEFEQLTKSYELSFRSVGEVLRSSFIPKSLGRKIAVNAMDLMKLMGMSNSDVKTLEVEPDNLGGQIRLFEVSAVQMGEMPSVNGQCSARGLAKIAAMLANGGTIDGKLILSKDTCDKFHSDYEETKILHPLEMQVNFSQGGVNKFLADQSAPTNHAKSCIRNRSGYVGWMGMGGSVFQWHLDHKIGFAYVPTLLAWEDVFNTRAALLQKIVLDCVKDMQTKEENVMIN